MFCDFYVLSHSKNGKVIKCDECAGKLALLYNNISKSYTKDEFFDFMIALDRLKEEEYFINYPEEDKMHLPSGAPGLFFSFRKEEIVELRTLLSDGWFNFQLMESVKNNLN